MKLYILLVLVLTSLAFPQAEDEKADPPVVDRVIYPPEQPKTRVGARVEYLDGAQIKGTVIAYNNQSVVLSVEDLPHVIPWADLTVGSAYRTARTLLQELRGGEDKLSGEDHIFLGEFCLSRGNEVTARYEFRQAIKLLGPAGDAYVKGVMEQFNDRRERMKEQTRPPRWKPGEEPEGQSQKNVEETLRTIIPLGANGTKELPAELHQRIIEQYDRFSEVVSTELKTNLERIETEHFLIYTNWGSIDRAGIELKLEQAYKTVAKMLGVPLDKHLFLGKCPVFCFRTAKQFRDFARIFDNHKARDLLAYSYMADSGHAHIATWLRSDSVADFDRFSMAISHECCHVFLHRIAPGKPVRGWVSEGFANYVAEKALGNYSPYAETADMLAWVYLEKNIPAFPMFREEGLVPRHQYPLAYSIVEYLVEKDSEAFGEVLLDMKAGHSPRTAIIRQYEGLTLRQLERQWREDVRKRIFIPEKTTFEE